MAKVKTYNARDRRALGHYINDKLKERGHESPRVGVSHMTDDSVILDGADLTFSFMMDLGEVLGSFDIEVDVEHVGSSYDGCDVEVNMIVSNVKTLPDALKK